MSYFVFNKTADYARGYGEHVSFGPEGLSTEPGFYGRAVFFSRILDSASEETGWHRMVCQKTGTGRGVVQVSFYTADSGELQKLADEGMDVRTVIRSETLSVQQKKDILKPFLRKKQLFGPDILLHGLEGRYLWFLLEIYPQTEEPVGLGDFRIWFPAVSWAAYLPELYRREMKNGSFLDRFLAVFQSLYDDAGDYIREFPQKLDPSLSPAGFLQEMAGWLDVEEPHMWTERSLRFLLEHIMEFSKARGTRRGIELFVELYTGEKPFVIEWQDWKQYRDEPLRGSLLRQLYEDDPGSLIVLVREEAIPGYRDYQTLLGLLESQKPVQLSLKLIVLKPYIFIDGYSYLGVNSVLGHYEEAVLGGTSRLAFATVTESEERSES